MRLAFPFAAVATAVAVVAAAAVAAAAPGIAHAEEPPADATREAALVPLRLDVVSLGPRRFDGAAFLQGVVASDGGEAAAGARITLSAAGCRYLDAGGQLRRHAEATSGEAWARACLWRIPNGLPGSGEVAARLDWEVRPALAARRFARPAPYSRATFEASSALVETEDAISRATVWRMTPRLDVVWQDDGGVLRRQEQFSFTVDGVRVVHPRRGWLAPIPADEVAILGLDVGIVIAAGGREASRGELRFAGFTGLRLGRGVTLDADLRLGIGSVDLGPQPDPGVSVARMITTPTGAVGAGWTGGPFQARLDVARTFFPTFDVELAVEDRLAARAAWARRRGVEVAVTGFAARTAAWGLYGPPRVDLTGGAAVTLAVPLARGLELGVQAELARSFYAALDGDAARGPALGGRALATLTWRVAGAR